VLASRQLPPSGELSKCTLIDAICGELLAFFQALQ
jgi:hypothetical protein